LRLDPVRTSPVIQRGEEVAERIEKVVEEWERKFDPRGGLTKRS
jgi:hypothetical protein